MSVSSISVQPPTVTHTHATQQVSHETAIFPIGGHGVGLGIGSYVTSEGELVNGHPWTARMLAFVKRQAAAAGMGGEKGH